jgi:hypothetical protein
MGSFYKKVEDLFEYAKSELRQREGLPSSSGPLDRDTNPKREKGEELPNPVVSQVNADVRSAIEKRAVNGRIQFRGSSIVAQEAEPVVERHITFMIGSVVVDITLPDARQVIRAGCHFKEAYDFSRDPSFKAAVENLEGEGPFYLRAQTLRRKLNEASHSTDKIEQLTAVALCEVN